MAITCSLEKNSVTIDLFVTKYVEGLSNNVRRYPSYISKNKRDEKDAFGRIIDLGNVTLDILIEGYITDTGATGNPANYTAFQVKEALLDMVRGNYVGGVYAGGPATLTYRSGTANHGKTFDGSSNDLKNGNVFLEDIRIEEVEMDHANNITDDPYGRLNTAKYFYSLKMIVGKERS